MAVVVEALDGRLLDGVDAVGYGLQQVFEELLGGVDKLQVYGHR